MMVPNPRAHGPTCFGAQGKLFCIYVHMYIYICAYVFICMHACMYVMVGR